MNKKTEKTIINHNIFINKIIKVFKMNTLKLDLNFFNKNQINYYRILLLFFK